MSASAPNSSGGGSGAGQAPPMYYCHECAIEIRPLMLPNPTCPRCNGEFVEEINMANSRPDEHDDEDAMQAFGVHAQPPFMGAARRSDFDGSSPAGQGMDLGTLLGGILRGLATAGSQPRSDGSTQSSNANNQGSSSSTASASGAGDNSANGNYRSGQSQIGPLNFSWGVGSYQSTQTGSGSRNSQPGGNESPSAGRTNPMGLNEYLRRSFENDDYTHDDGMGGAGGAADGRFFNMDNRTPRRPTEQEANNGGARDSEDRGAYPPELASIRDVFTNLFGGMGEGPASMLVDLFGGGMGRGRTGDYVWGQQGLDDVITQLMEQTRGSTAPPPASEEAIEKLERFSRKDKAKLSQARNRECSTCMDSFQEDEDGDGEVEPSMDSNRLSSTIGAASESKREEAADDDPPEVIPQDEQQDELIMMPCRHLFHEDCLLPWLKTNGTCPVCRVSLAPEKTSKPQEGEQGGSGSRGEASTSRPSDTQMSGIDGDEEDNGDDESPETIRERSRRAAEARFAGQAGNNTREERQAIPGSYLQPDELD